MTYLLVLVHLLRMGAFSDPNHWEASLGSHSFRVREMASKQLLEYDSLWLCRWLGRSHDPEVVRRAKSAYGYIMTRRLESLEPYPCLDALYYDTYSRAYQLWYRENRMAFLRRYGIGYPYQIHGANWESYRLGTRRWVGDLLDIGMPLWWTRIILLEMHHRDRLAGFGYVAPAK